MQIVKQKATILNETPDMLAHLEYCGRTCYKSHERITAGSAERFCKMILRNHHESVLEHGCITVKIITDRAIANELVRHRIASYSQESTRYCNYNGTDIKFIEPPFASEEAKAIWENDCKHAEYDYNSLIRNGEKPELARNVLPLSLATELVATANIREWRNILKQRTAESAHPQMRELANLILSEFMATSYSVLFQDIV